MLPIKAQRTTVKFCDEVEVDGYLLPDGEFRVGKISSSLSVGYGKDWIGQLKGKPLESLRAAGFTGSEKIIELDSIGGGGTKANTFSLQDFRKLIIYAASKGKPKAVALLNAIVDVGLEDWFRLSFGKDQLTLEEKKDKFYKTYAQTIDWLAEDRRDAQLISDHLTFLSVN